MLYQIMGKTLQNYAFKSQQIQSLDFFFEKKVKKMNKNRPSVKKEFTLLRQPREELKAMGMGNCMFLI